MKCPVCGKEMFSMVCDCGYDESVDYGKYPVLGRLSAPGVGDDLVRCRGCGGHTFTLSRRTGILVCFRCGRMLKMAAVEPEEPVVPVMPEVPVPQIRETGGPGRIMGIAAGWSHTVALYDDGTAAAIGDNGEGACEVSSWREIMAISAGNGRTTGLKRDGTVVTTDRKLLEQVQQWRDVTAISEGLSHIVGLRRDGTVVMAGTSSGKKAEVAQWRDIRAIAAGGTFTLGLDKSGKILAAGKGPGVKMLAGNRWNVQAIAAGYEHSAALTKDGRVLIINGSGSAAEMGRANGAVGAGYGYTAVLKENGNVLVTGKGTIKSGAVKQWKDLEMICAGYHHLVGLKKDGTLVAAGDDSAGQCQVHRLLRR